MLLFMGIDTASVVLFGLVCWDTQRKKPLAACMSMCRGPETIRDESVSIIAKEFFCDLRFASFALRLFRSRL